MSLGVYTDIIRIINNRIYAVRDTLGIKSIQLMPKPERLQPDMCPYVLITPDVNFISEDYGASIQNRRKEGIVNLSLWVEYPILNRDSHNSAYNGNNIIDESFNNIIDDSGFLLSSDEGYTGALPFMEALLDAINTDSTGVLNPQIQDSALSMTINVQNVIKHEQTLEFEILLGIRTKSFIINNRQQI